MNSVAESETRTRTFRSPYWLVGWAVTALAVGLLVAFFAATDWSQFEGTPGDYLNLAKGPLAALVLVGMVRGLAAPESFRRPRSYAS